MTNNKVKVMCMMSRENLKFQQLENIDEVWGDGMEDIVRAHITVLIKDACCYRREV
jgi:hypothetical protein